MPSTSNKAAGGTIQQQHVETIDKVKAFVQTLNQQDSDFAILFRHVYCFFNRTLYYSHDTVCPKGFFITQNNNPSSNSSNSSTTTDHHHGSSKNSTINLFFVLDTPRLASEADVVIESSNQHLHGFVNIMVRITSSQSFNNSSSTNSSSGSNNSNHHNTHHTHNHNDSSSDSRTLRPSSSSRSGTIQPFIDEEHSQDPSLKLFQNSIISSDISLKTFCEDYIKAVHNKAAVQQILVFFREISESIGSSDRFKIEIFKNCTCRSFIGDFYTVSRDILSICKVASFDKHAKKGLSKEQVEYVNSIKQDKPFYTLLLKMDRLIKDIVNPMFNFMNYCHRKADCSISHLLFKHCVKFKITSVSPQKVNNNKSNPSTTTTTTTSTGPFITMVSAESSLEESGQLATPPNVYIPDVNTELREITFSKSSHLYKQLPTDPTTRKSQIEKDVFRLGALFLSYVTGSKQVGEVAVESVSDMLKQLRMSVDYLRQTQVQFENMLITKQCGDDTKIYLMSERLAHLTALHYSLSIFENLISEMVEHRTYTFKEMLRMVDRPSIDKMIENLRDNSFDEKMTSCARISNTVKAIIGNNKGSTSEKKKQINERSRIILSDVTNSSFTAPDSPMAISTTPNNKRKLEASTVQYFCSKNKIPPTSKSVKRDPGGPFEFVNSNFSNNNISIINRK